MDRIWVERLIYPELMTHLFIRAYRKDTAMLPYRHWNYARYIFFQYILTQLQTQVDKDGLNVFFMGKHMCKHSYAFDMAIPKVDLSLWYYSQRGWHTGLYTIISAIVRLLIYVMFQDENVEYDTMTRSHK